MDEKIIAVVLAAGRGLRLSSEMPNFYKPLADINGKPIINFCIEAVQDIADKIVIVVNTENIDAIRNAIKIDVSYVIQESPKGTADAIMCAIKSINESDSVIVLCADNIFAGDDIRNVVQAIKGNDVDFAWTAHKQNRVDASRYAVFSDAAPFPHFVQKPLIPPSDYCWCGPIAFRNAGQFRNYFSKISVSKNGEYEVVDILNLYLKNDKAAMILSKNIFFDIGTPQSLKTARDYFKENS